MSSGRNFHDSFCSERRTRTDLSAFLAIRKKSFRPMQRMHIFSVLTILSTIQLLAGWMAYSTNNRRYTKIDRMMMPEISWRRISLTVIVCSLAISACSAFQSLHAPLPAWQGRGSALMMSSAGEGDPALSAMQSLADYHEGEWKGKARSFTITPDVAAGIVQRKVSPEYTAVVKLTTSATSVDPSTSGVATNTISLSESVSWEDNFSHRSIPLFTSSGMLSSDEPKMSSSAGDLDVDDVDASYSIDHTNPSDFPSVLSGLNGNSAKPLQFVVEHCIAAGENRRCRCFAVYGEDDALLRVVIADEERVEKAEEEETTTEEKTGIEGNDMLTINDIIEMENDVDRLVDKISAKIEKTPAKNIAISKEKIADDGSTAASRLGQLGQSIGDSNDDTQALSPYDISLLEVTNGVWLGDVIIRETPNVDASPKVGGKGKGFGQKTSESPSSSSKTPRYLGEWNAGVQKVAWRWMWNFEEEIRQVVDAGKALGSSMDDFMKRSLPGNVCVDESFSRRKPKDERMVYIDWGQDSVGFLLGPFSVQVPRYVNFDPSATTPRAAAVIKPFFTEFGIFQSALLPEGPDEDGIIDVNVKSDKEEICCSKIGRLYNFEGRLRQGCTSFYTFKRFEVDEDDEDDDDDFDVYE